MSYHKIDTNSYSGCGCHYTGKVSIESDITEAGRNLLVGKGIECNRKNQWL